MKRTFEVLDYLGESTTIKTVKRVRDEEVFTLGDRVTNDAKMTGDITKMEYSLKSDSIYVYTTWSGVGTNLDSIKHLDELPSKHQLGDKVNLDFNDAGKLENCVIRKVHFTENKVLYDVEIYGVRNGKPWRTKLYNVDSFFVNKKYNEETKLISFNSGTGVLTTKQNEPVVFANYGTTDANITIKPGTKITFGKQ